MYNHNGHLMCNKTYYVGGYYICCGLNNIRKTINPLTTTIFSKIFVFKRNVINISVVLSPKPLPFGKAN